MLIHFHLTLAYSIKYLLERAESSDSFLAKTSINLALTGYLLVALIRIVPIADASSAARIDQTQLQRAMFQKVYELRKSHRTIKRIGFWYHEHSAPYGIFERFFLNEDDQPRSVGFFATHGTYYSGRRPKWSVNDWISYNLDEASRPGTMVVAFCSPDGVSQSRIRWTTPELSVPIAKGLANALSSSDEWRRVGKFPYLGRNTRLCAYVFNASKR